MEYNFVFVFINGEQTQSFIEISAAPIENYKSVFNVNLITFLKTCKSMTKQTIHPEIYPYGMF